MLHFALIRIRKEPVPGFTRAEVKGCVGNEGSTADLAISGWTPVLPHALLTTDLAYSQIKTTHDQNMWLPMEQQQIIPARHKKYSQNQASK